MICSFTGCERVLAPTNKHGRCKSHKGFVDPTLYRFCAAEECGVRLRTHNRFDYCSNHKHLDREWRDYLTAKEKERVYGNPEFLERRRQYQRDRYQEDRENRSEYFAAYYASPEYRIRHAEQSSSRRAKKLQLFVEDIDRAIVFERDNGLCHLCSLPVDPSDWDLDHVIPLSLNGPHAYANVAVSHEFCNTSKNNRYTSPNHIVEQSARQSYKEFHGFEFEL